MLVRGHGLTKHGAMRALTEQTIVWNPDLLAVSEIDDGDALALATKTNRQWSYRGGQALLWRSDFTPIAVHEAYLSPVLPPLPWRGVLRIDLRAGETTLSMLCTRFAPDRRAIRDQRFVRTLLRNARLERAILCITNPPANCERAFAHRGFSSSNSVASADVLMTIRGCDLRTSTTIASGGALGTQIIAGVRA